jgi:UDP-N-acetylmuramyl pentapeptide synthase
MKLSIGELAKAVHGSLSLGSLPPLAGPFEPVRRIVVESRLAKPGDVYWGLIVPGLDGALLAEDAYLRGAFGVVVSGRHVEPWAGRFSIQVQDANLALAELAAERLDRKPHGPLKNTDNADSTDLVQAMLAGYSVNLEMVLDRLSRSLTSYVA